MPDSGPAAKEKMQGIGAGDLLPRALLKPLKGCEFLLISALEAKLTA